MKKLLSAAATMKFEKWKNPPLVAVHLWWRLKEKKKKKIPKKENPKTKRGKKEKKRNREKRDFGKTETTKPNPVPARGTQHPQPVVWCVVVCVGVLCCVFSGES